MTHEPDTITNGKTDPSLNVHELLEAYRIENEKLRGLLDSRHKEALGACERVIKYAKELHGSGVGETFRLRDELARIHRWMWPSIYAVGWAIGSGNWRFALGLCFVGTASTAAIGWLMNRFYDRMKPLPDPQEPSEDGSVDVEVDG